MPDVEAVKDWIRFARMDLSAAAFLQGHNPLPTEIICYHCQQAADKAIKAVLVRYDADVPHIHDLNKLLAATKQYENSMQRLSQQANWLTNYATFTRYPSDIEIGETDMKIALKNAEEILDQVEFLLSGVLEDNNCGQNYGSG